MRLEHKGRLFNVEIVRDEDMGPPWKEHDGHGIISDWTKRPKGPRELVLWRASGGACIYYDVDETLKIAKRDSWGPGTPAEAARADYERMRGWCNDEWYWVGVVVTLLKADDDAPDGYFETKHGASLWGIESDAGEYLNEVAKELAEQLIEESK